jgi:transposase
MNKAEMAYKKPRPQPASADERGREAFHKTVEDQIGTRDDNAVVVTIDQLRKTVGADLTYAWFPIDERPAIGVSASRDGINLLGALTEHGETLFLECNDSFTKEVTVRFLQTLQEKFGKNLIVVLDQAPYFLAKKVKTFVEDIDIDLVYFPAGSPDLNPTEECWRQFRKTLGNQYFGSLDELRAAIRPALKSIDPPGIYQYLCR